MQQLLLLAAMHTGVSDIFFQVVPRWALAALFRRILGSDAAGAKALTTTALQDWLLDEKIKVQPKVILEFFRLSPSGDSMSQAEFIQVLTHANWHLRCKAASQ